MNGRSLKISLIIHLHLMVGNWDHPMEKLLRHGPCWAQQSSTDSFDQAAYITSVSVCLLPVLFYSWNFFNCTKILVIPLLQSDII